MKRHVYTAQSGLALKRTFVLGLSFGDDEKQWPDDELISVYVDLAFVSALVTSITLSDFPYFVQQFRSVH